MQNSVLISILLIGGASALSVLGSAAGEALLLSLEGRISTWALPAGLTHAGAVTY